MRRTHRDTRPRSTSGRPSHRIDGTAKPTDRLEAMAFETPQAWSGRAVAGSARAAMQNALARAVTHPDPANYLCDYFDNLQTSQQARFAALPLSARESSWVQFVHGEILRENQAAYESAFNHLRKLVEDRSADCLVSSVQSECS